MHLPTSLVSHPLRILSFITLSETGGAAGVCMCVCVVILSGSEHPNTGHSAVGDAFPLREGGVATGGMFSESALGAQ